MAATDSPGNPKERRTGNCASFEHHYKGGEGRNQRPQGNALSCIKRIADHYIKKEPGGEADTDAGSTNWPEKQGRQLCSLVSVQSLF